MITLQTIQKWRQTVERNGDNWTASDEVDALEAIDFLLKEIDIACFHIRHARQQGREQGVKETATEIAEMVNSFHDANAIRSKYGI